MPDSYTYMPPRSKNRDYNVPSVNVPTPGVQHSTPALYDDFPQPPPLRSTRQAELYVEHSDSSLRPPTAGPQSSASSSLRSLPMDEYNTAARPRVDTLEARMMSTDTLSSSASSTNNAVETSKSVRPGKDSRGHKKTSSSNNVIEEVFGIYPEKKKMGAGVSLADVMASKLFSRREKTVAPSPIPTPRAPSAASSYPTTSKPVFHSQRHPQRSTARPQSQKPTEYATDRRQSEAPSQKVISPVDQHKLDELMARQKLLELRILELKEERDSLLELDVDRAVQAYDRNMQPERHSVRQSQSQQQQQPQPEYRQEYRQEARLQPVIEYNDAAAILAPKHSASPSAAARTEKTRGTTSRQFPSSKTIQPLVTSPMAIPSVVPFTSSAPYTQRPLPQPPTDASPPPEYSPPAVPIPNMHAADVKAFQPAIKEITLTLPGGMYPSVVFEKRSPMNIDVKVSPRDEVEVDDILGWFDTFKFASTGPRGRGPSIPLPAPPSNQDLDVNIDSKPRFPDEKRARSKPRRERRERPVLM